MPGTSPAVIQTNYPFTPLVLSVAEDTYTITLDRSYSMTGPLILRVTSDTASFLLGRVTTGPYCINPSTWVNEYLFTGKQGDVITLYVKAVSGTPSLYIVPVATFNS